MNEGSVIYDSFNARYLTFTQVAEGFVSNSYFEQATGNSHSLLTGPRGCGKTTLLKMLTPSALKTYNDGEMYKSIPFWGVYIPTDIQWKKQLDKLSSEIQNSNVVEIISRGTVLVTILQSFCKTFSFIIKTECENSDVMEMNLSRRLIDVWKLPNITLPTIDHLDICLMQIIGDLNAEIRRSKFTSEEIHIHPLFYYDYMDLVRISCEVFEGTTGIKSKNWALCFDELEIAPKWLQEELLVLLRSTDQKYIFKLTTAPIVSFFKQISSEINPIANASENNDFKVIKIWTSNQIDFKSWRRFCGDLLNNKIFRRYGRKIEPELILGKSNMDTSLMELFPKEKFSLGKADFEHNTPTWFALKELAKIDASFRKFLVSKGVDPINPVPVNDKAKDEIYRKIKQVAIYRLHLIKEGGLRTRKILPLYYGLPLIYDICDGNPRIFIGLIDELLSKSELPGNNYKYIPINLQSRIIRNVSQKYLLMLASHPDANVELRGENFNIKELLESIGEFFYGEILHLPFKMEPYGSFIVDEELPAKILFLIELALYLGAVVYLDQPTEEILTNRSVFNKRFRLSYVLSPYFRLMSRDNREINLSRILSPKNTPGQQNLFSQL